MRLMVSYGPILTDFCTLKFQLSLEMAFLIFFRLIETGFIDFVT